MGKLFSVLAHLSVNQMNQHAEHPVFCIAFTQFTLPPYPGIVF